MPDEVRIPEGAPAKQQEAIPVPASHVPRLGAPAHLISDNFWSNFKQFFTERPVRIAERKGVPFTQGAFGAGVADNFKEFFSSRPMPKSRGNSGLEVNWGAGFGGFTDRVKEFFFPTKQAPLPFAVKPMRVKDIWSKDENFGWTQAISMTVHGALIALLVIPLFTHVISKTQAKNKPDVTAIDISDYVGKLPSGNDRAGGGGGGGAREILPATKGRAPKFAKTQLTPPTATFKNPAPKLPVDPTLLGAPDMKMTNPPLSNLGDPMAGSVNLSNGPGGGSGIGSGEAGGIGSGSGAGLGPGEEGGTGGGVFRAGVNGVGMPSCYYKPEPTYSEEARKAKYAGIVVVEAIITLDGHVTNPRIISSPGLGLDEKTIETVKTWRCKPAIGPGGKPVKTSVPIEVTYRLF
ncbi:MAG TPA: energy transducer TonB [Candidatus Eremiobacteraceae bacterium]|nr:energy transducer TonB [Candidatus Eremiobacteraceae bacterium]